MMIKQISPLVTVDEIEPCLPFWTELGFDLIATVPHDDSVGFAMLNHGSLIMYQSTPGVEADLGASGAPAELEAEMGSSTSALFVEVEDHESVPEAKVIVPRRKTFYGVDEAFGRDGVGVCTVRWTRRRRVTTQARRHVITAP